MSGKQRLFFALRPPADIALALHSMASGLPAPAVVHPAAQLHLTLAFLDMLDGEHRRLAAQVASHIHAPVFDLVLDQLDSFPPAAVVWAGCRQPPQALLDLMRRLRAALAAAGLSVDTRAPLPHVSLAKQLRHWPAGVALQGVMRWRVREFHLFASLSGRGRLQYQSLGRWPLDGPANQAQL